MPAKKKAAAKKPAATKKKAAPKKAAPKKAAAKKAPAKKKAASSAGCPEGHRRVNVKMPTGGRRAVCAITSQGGLAKAVAAKGEVKASDARKVFAAFAEIAQAEAKAGVPTVIPGIGKIRVVRRKARSAKTIPNPFDGGKTQLKVKARPAMNVVKIRAASAIKKAAAKSS